VLLHLLWFLIFLSLDPLTRTSSFNDHRHSSSLELSTLCSSPPSPSCLRSSSHNLLVPAPSLSILVGASKPHKPIIQSDRIEDVDATRLFRLIEEHDYLAVFFCECYL
jgi:hypothetical protein